MTELQASHMEVREETHFFTRGKIVSAYGSTMFWKYMQV
jgi:hypothetical protein